MSHEAVDAFWKRVETDRDLCRELNGLLAGSGGEREVSASALVPFARKHGFEFTEDELLSRAEASDDTELSEEDLDAVAGGGGCSPHTAVATSKYFSAEIDNVSLAELEEPGGAIDFDPAEEATAPVRIRIRV